MEVSSRWDLEKNNKINALKFLVFKALKRSSYTSNSKIGYMKTIGVELPLSQDIFNKFFKQTIPKIGKIESDSVNLKVSVNELKNILGENWHIYNHANSSTRQRVLRLIQTS